MSPHASSQPTEAANTELITPFLNGLVGLLVVLALMVFIYAVKTYRKSDPFN